MTEPIPIKQIKQDSALQPRAKMDLVIIDEYTDAMKAGSAFPAITVFKVGEDYLLVDGYHRFMAAQGAKLKEILCDIRAGTMRDAILFSAGVNATHGLRRTNADKNRAALILLKDKEWKGWADTKIAAVCNISVDLVAKVRASLGKTDSATSVRKVERAGKVIKMNTSKIGKTKKSVVQDEDGHVEGRPVIPDAPPVTDSDRERKARLNPPESAPQTTTPAPDAVIGGCRTLKEAEDGADVPGIVDPRQPLEPRKDKHYYATELLQLMPESTRKEVDQLLKEHTSWKTVDVFYFGIQALVAPKPAIVKKVP